MSLTYIILVAFGLSIDAFAVSISEGLTPTQNRLKKAVLLSLACGLFQGVMPLIGYLLGFFVKDLIISLDHWIAFILLFLLGLKMIYEAVFDKGSEETENCRSELYCIFFLALATSIDALVVGFSFSLVEVPIIIPSLIIFIITAAMSFVGVELGNKLSKYLDKRFEAVGGIVIIIIGIKILVEHLS